LILYTHYDPTIWELLESLRSHEVHCFVTCRWSLEVDDQQAIALRLGEWIRSHPRHHIIHLAPDEPEAAVLNRLGLPVVVCSRNCLIDDAIYRIHPDQPKRYRAIYDARLTPFKRHELAAQIRDLALITYDIPLNREENYNRRTRDILAQAIWLNGPFSQVRRMLSSEEVSIHLNQARVGLILSSLEGANYASIQYLLCGLPVVTTHNRGGRNAFFSTEHVIWAEDTPESVASAVDTLIARNLDPEKVRETALQLIRAHRKVFIQQVEAVLAGQPDGQRSAAPDWNSFFSNKLLKKWTPLQLLALKVHARWRLKLKSEPQRLSRAA